ncbi:MAG: hypothetical protein IKV54_03840 [Clostridia bacterium]|nr:hypothetical protein [Clostridia bacterium]
MKKIIYFITAMTMILVLTVFVAAAGDSQITYLSENMTVNVGESVTLSCEAQEAPEGNMLYVWYASDSDGENGSPMTSPSPSGDYEPDTLSPGEYYYYCLVYYMYEDSSNLIKSDVVTLTVNGAVEVERPEVDVDIEKRYEVARGGVLTITYRCVIPEAPYSLVYQWYTENPDTGVFDKLSGANTDTLTVPTDKVGSSKYFCIANTVCGSSYSPNRQSVITTVTVTGHDHSFGEYTTISAPTCTEDGKDVRYCSSCGASEERVISAGGHSFGRWNTVTEATESRDGSESRSCSECGKTETRVIPRLEDDGTTAVEDDTTAAQETTGTDTTVETTAPTTSSDTTASSGNYTKTESGFPWWVAILLFGMVCAVAFAALAGFNFGKAKTLSAVASKYLFLKNNNNQK